MVSWNDFDPVTALLRTISPIRHGANIASSILGDQITGVGRMVTGASPVTHPIRRVNNPAGTIGNQNLKEQLGNLFQQQDPTAQLYESLISQLQQPVSQPQGINTEDLMMQVKKAINPLYDARVKSAQGQTFRNSAEVEKMYRALADDYKQLAPEQAAQSKQAQQEIDQIYGELRSNVQGDYSRVAKEQGDLFNQLGIQSALPEVLAEQNSPVQQVLSSAAQNEAQQKQRYLDMGQADQNYYREGSPLAISAGNDVRMGLQDELTSYLQQLEGERASGIQSTYLDQLGQAQSQLAQQQQLAQSEASRKQEMLFNLLQSQMEAQNALDLAGIKAGSTGTGPLDKLMGSLDPVHQAAVASAFTRLQRSPEAIYGKTRDPRNPNPSTYVETTPEWYAAQADEMLRRGEIDDATHQALLQYLQLYFTK